MQRLLARSALPVDSRRRRRHRESSRPPCIAADVETLLAGLADATEDDILDLLRFDARAPHQLFQDQRAEHNGMDVLELAVALADRRPDGFNDHGFAHFHELLIGRGEQDLTSATNASRAGVS